MTHSEQIISSKSGYVLVERPPGFVVLPDERPREMIELLAACNQAGCRRVLIVGPRTQVNLSTIDLFNLGEQVAKIGLQIAVVELHDASVEDVRFLENVATNRGGPIQFFDNEQDAKQWLGIE